MKNTITSAAVWLCLAAGLPAHAVDFISPNGYSGLGLVPSAQVLSTGSGVINYDTALPGAPNSTGYNTQIGFGIYDHVELIGRLATNDLHCNMFRAGACPTGNIRDFSASFKWSPPIYWLEKNDAHLAFGVNDFGGAATYFRSYYAVASKSFDNIDLTVGSAHAAADHAMLDGYFGALTWHFNNWSQLSVQKVGDNSWASAAVSAPIADTGLSAWFNYNRSLGDNTVTGTQWTGFGISIPLDRSEKANPSTSKHARLQASRLVARIAPQDLAGELTKNGFYNPKIGKTSAGRLVVEVDSTSYQRNILDAAGVALGLVAGAYPDSAQDFDLIISTRGIRQLLIRSNSVCVKRWLEADTWCEQFEIKSLNTQPYDTADVAWSAGTGWNFRPEIILTPTLVSTIGTEYGVFDIDLGMNVNAVLPLWQGAYTDINHTYPLDYRTTNFEPGGPFYGSRLKSVTSRRMLHQLLSFPRWNTQARLSAGMAYNVWDGKQIETYSQTDNGRHKLSLTAGHFTTDTLAFNNEKSYHLTSYRYTYDDAQKTSSEVTYGKFWTGDNGYMLGQRFWHGDTALALYIRRSRLNDFSPLVSFAGIQFVIPLTPRKQEAMQYLSLRGGNQWTYTVESRIMDKTNALTSGYGEIPKTGDPLVQTFNRDRNSTAYYEGSMGRIKNAFQNLTAD